MARENKQKRDAKRFGEPTRLADRIHHLPVAIPRDLDPQAEREMRGVVDRFIKSVEASTVIECSQVADYFFEVFGGEAFNWRSDIACWMPPFPDMFLEAKRPGTFFDGRPFPKSFPIRWGWRILTTFADPGRAAEFRRLSGVSGAKVTFSQDGSWMFAHNIDLPPTTELLLHCTLVEEFSDGYCTFGASSLAIAIDKAGEIVMPPEHATNCIYRDTTEAQDYAEQRAHLLAAPLFLALVFLNSQNVPAPEVHPDRKLNRLRKEHGHRPFVSHRTIDINAVKRTLSREGQVESTGLKNALHRCRGHFANYGPDKPMFGRLVGRYWIPPHERGSAERGRIISDYRVSRPA